MAIGSNEPGIEMRDTSAPVVTIPQTGDTPRVHNEAHIVLEPNPRGQAVCLSALLAEYLSERISDLEYYETDGTRDASSNHQSHLGSAGVTASIFAEPRGIRRFDPVRSNEARSFVLACRPARIFGLQTWFQRGCLLEMQEAVGNSLFLHVYYSGDAESTASEEQDLNRALQSTPCSGRLIVWLGGGISDDRAGFETVARLPDLRVRVYGIVRLLWTNNKLKECALREAIQRHGSLKEAIHTRDLPLMQRQRLAVLRRQLFREFAKAGL